MNKVKQLRRLGTLVLALSVASSTIAQEISAPGDSIDYEVLELWADCIVMDESGWVQLRDDCVDVLDPIFMQDDFWGFNLNHSKDVLPYIRPHGDARQHINLRAIYLAYSFEDIDLIQGQPKMRDIFDIKRTERAPLVDKVLHDPLCSKLWNGPWQSDNSLNKSCYSRDLVLYAYWIDTCITNLDVYKKLNMPYEIYKKLYSSNVTSKHIGDSSFTRKLQRLTDKRRQRFERGTGSPQLTETVVSGGLASWVTAEQLTEMNLKSLWVMKHCDSLPHDTYQEAVANIPKLGTTQKEVGWSDQWFELVELYDRAMGVAIRTGDDWAIRSFEPPRTQTAAYLSFLSEVNLSLYHRYMSTHEYGPKAKEERLEHAVQAFKLAREAHGKELIIKDEDATYLPTQRLSHYTNLSGIHISDEYDETYLDSLLEIENSENP